MAESSDSQVRPRISVPGSSPAAGPAFHRACLARLTRFNTKQRLAVCCFLSELVNGERIAALIDQIARENMACPHCQAANNAAVTASRNGLAALPLLQSPADARLTA